MLHLKIPHDGKSHLNEAFREEGSFSQERKGFSYPRKCWSSSCVSQHLPVPVLDLAIKLPRFSSLSTNCPSLSKTSPSSRCCCSSSSPSSSPSPSQCFLFWPFLRCPFTTDSMASVTVSPSLLLPPAGCSSSLSRLQVMFISTTGGGEGGGEGRGCFLGRPGPLFFTMLFPVRACLCSFLTRRILLTWCRLCLEACARREWWGKDESMQQSWGGERQEEEAEPWEWNREGWWWYCCRWCKGPSGSSEFDRAIPLVWIPDDPGQKKKVGFAIVSLNFLCFPGFYLDFAT